MLLTLGSFCTGLAVFLLCDGLIDLVIGYTGKKGQIINHYNIIRGDKIIDEYENIYEITIMSFIKNDTKKAFFYIISMFLTVLIVTKSVFLSLLICPFGLMIPIISNSNSKRKRISLINTQFRDALSSIISSLKAGISLNTSLSKCCEDLESLHSRYKEKIILIEFKKMSNDLKLGMPLDECLKSFDSRMNNEEISEFVNSILILNQKGGNILDVMSNVISVITDKLIIVQEIDVMTASKKLESMILSFAPLALIAILSLFTPKYMEPLYNTTIGQFLTAIGIGFIFASYFIGKKITDIQI